MRAVSGVDRGSRPARPPGARDLAGPGRRSRLRGALRERASVRARSCAPRRRAKRTRGSRPQPGEESQVDYGDGPMVRDPETGKYRRSRLFVMTLGYSRKTVRLLTWKSSSRIWAELHERAFRRLGGATRVVVLDNLKEGVTPPRRVRPRLEPALSRRARTLRCDGASLSRAATRIARAKVESSIRHTQAEAQGLRFETLDAGAGLPRSVGRALGRHPHPWHHQAPGRGDVRRRAAASLAASARALPLLRSTARAPCTSTGPWKSRAPTTTRRPATSAARLLVQWDALHVRILDPRTGTLLREHRPPRARTAPDARGGSPEAHAGHDGAASGAQLPRRRSRRRRLRRHPSPRRRGRRAAHPRGARTREAAWRPSPVDEACAAALELAVPTYRFVRRFLERRAPLTLKQVDPLIRELTHYRDLIDRRTQGDPP